MATDFAVIVVDLAVVPVTVTQSPTATDDAAAVAFCVNVVDDVHVTVTWPVSWLWTSIDDAVMAATEPDAPGPNRPRGVVVAAPAAAGPATKAIATAAATVVVTRRVERCIVVSFSLDRFHHSLRRASIGASRAARLAG